MQFGAYPFGPSPAFFQHGSSLIFANFGAIVKSIS